MHHPTDRIAHTTAFVTRFVEHWQKREIAQWVYPMKDRSDEPLHIISSYHEATSHSTHSERVEEIYIYCNNVAEIIILLPPFSPVTNTIFIYCDLICPHWGVVKLSNTESVSMAISGVIPVISETIVSLGVKRSGRREHDGGVEVADDSTHGAGSVDTGLGSSGPGLQRSQQERNLRQIKIHLELIEWGFKQHQQYCSYSQQKKKIK